MKKLTLKVSTVLMLATIALTTTNCLGTFSLSNKAWEMNRELTGNKFVNNLVFWAAHIIPVYPIVYFVDGLVLNTIEFWTGSNPVAMEEGQEEKLILPSDDRIYEITASKNRFDIKVLEGKDAGENVALVFENADFSWNLAYKNDYKKLSRAVTVDGVEKIEVFSADGNSVIIDADNKNINSVLGMLKSADTAQESIFTLAK